MYKAIDVWKRLTDGALIRYRCFQVLPENKYCVQSADFYQQGMNEAQIWQLEKQYIELLLDEAPNDRIEMYETLEEAIFHHDQDFRDIEEEAQTRE